MVGSGGSKEQISSSSSTTKHYAENCSFCNLMIMILILRRENQRTFLPSVICQKILLLKVPIVNLKYY